MIQDVKEYGVLLKLRRRSTRYPVARPNPSRLMRCRRAPRPPSLRAVPPRQFLSLRQFLPPRQCVRWQSTAPAAEQQPPSTSARSAAGPPSDPLLPPSAVPHHSLATFLAHARRTGLAPSSTTYVGTHYEYTCQNALARLGFALARTGGRADAGIDLLGTWRLPGSSGANESTGEDNRNSNGGPPPLRCLIQCKALAKKVGPHVVREVEGAFAGAPSGWRGDTCVGVLCASRPATPGVREAIRRSKRGLVWMFVEERTKGGEGEKGDRTGGRVRQMLWNDRVAEMGAEGVDVGLRYVAGGVDKEVVLMWKGEVWERSTDLA